MVHPEDSKELIVVRYRPWHRVRRFLILLGFSIMAGIGGFFLGGAHYEFRYEQASDKNTMLEARVERLQAENTRLQQRLARLDRGHRIDEQAVREARHTIERLEAKIKSLEGDVTFYRNIMAPSSRDEGLQVQNLRLQPGPGDRRYSYRLVLTQVGDNRSYIEGVVAVNLIGVQNGERRIIALREVTDAVDSLGIKFRFRYFQNVAGELILPPGFSPSEIQVVAKSTGRKSAHVERTFEWQRLVEG